jgi:hypothetical protein
VRNELRPRPQRCQEHIVAVSVLMCVCWWVVIIDVAGVLRSCVHTIYSHNLPFSLRRYATDLLKCRPDARKQGSQEDSEGTSQEDPNQSAGPVGDLVRERMCCFHMCVHGSDPWADTSVHIPLQIKALLEANLHPKMQGHVRCAHHFIYGPPCIL